jgi:hypothetical protein
MANVIRKTGVCKLCFIESHLVDNSRYCRECRNLRYRASRYNITEEEILDLLIEDTCAICKEKCSGKNKVIDHCHSSGKIRGILCRKCNLGLAHFNDNIEIFVNAIKYLKK